VLPAGATDAEPDLLRQFGGGVLRPDRLAERVPVEPGFDNAVDRREPAGGRHAGIHTFAQPADMVGAGHSRSAQLAHLPERDVAHVRQNFKRCRDATAQRAAEVAEPVESEAVHGHQKHAGRAARGEALAAADNFIGRQQGRLDRRVRSGEKAEGAVAVAGGHIYADLAEQKSAVVEAPPRDDVCRGAKQRRLQRVCRKSEQHLRLTPRDRLSGGGFAQ